MGYQQKHKEYIYRHMYPLETSRHFTYHKHPDGKGGFLDNGICELCGARGTYTLIAEEKKIVKSYSDLKTAVSNQEDALGLLGLLFGGKRR